MPATTVQAEFSATPEATWALLGSFEGLDAVFPGIENLVVDDGRRTFSMMGMRITEQLVRIDDEARSITYSIVDGVPVEAHEATITVRPAASGCTVEWAVSTVPEDAQPLFADTYQRALDHLHGTLDHD